jgi:hypothetical protein
MSKRHNFCSTTLQNFECLGTRDRYFGDFFSKCLFEIVIKIDTNNNFRISSLLEKSLKMSTLSKMSKNETWFFFVHIRLLRFEV